MISNCFSFLPVYIFVNCFKVKDQTGRMYEQMDGQGYVQTDRQTDRQGYKRKDGANPKFPLPLYDTASFFFVFFYKV